MKIVTIVGARPQFIKAAVVSSSIKKFNQKINEIIIHTGQHYDSNMSDIFFNELNIPKPNYDLGIGGGTHGQNTGRMIEAIETILVNEKPDFVIVYGDTDSTLAGAISASKIHIPIAHIESGLRSFNKKMPEELNRILTDHSSSLLFTPTQTASQNLINEGIDSSKIFQVGDVMFDAVKYYQNFSSPPGNFNLDKKFILTTLHRAENTDNLERLEEILNTLNELSKVIKILLPLHPRTKKIIENNRFNLENIICIEPVGYLQMIWLISNSQFIITDSGGLQKEAYFLGKRCLVTRNETEWVELLNNDFNILVSADRQRIIDGAELIMKNNAIFQSDSLKSNVVENLFGNGDASSLIVNHLFAQLKELK